MFQSLKYFLLSATFLVCLSSCKNDIDLLADYQETMVVYGILNQDTIENPKTTYIRVNKAFLGPGNALEMAQNFDSINYGTNLQVTMERWKNGSKLNTYTLVPDSSIAKDGGLFSAPKQVLYRLDAILDENSEYHLQVKNKTSGKIATGKTSLLKPHTINLPAKTTTFPISFATSYPFKVEWTPGNGGRRYQLLIRFNYKEIDLLNPGDTARKHVDWYFGTKKTTALTGSPAMSESFKGQGFYSTIGAYVKPKANVQRIAGDVDFIVIGVSEDLNTFFEVNQPSTGIVQDKLQYTNLTGALGILGARYHTGVYGKKLDIKSLDSLKNGIHTKNLGF